MTTKKRKHQSNETKTQETNETMKELKKRLKVAEQSKKEAESRAREAEQSKEKAEQSKEEAESRAREAQQLALRYKFAMDIDDKTINSRESMMAAIQKANFEADQEELKEKIPQTNDFAADDRSSTTKIGAVKMSNFKRSQVAGTKDDMNVKVINLPLYEIAKKYLKKNKKNIKTILSEETEIITKIQVALTWLKINASVNIKEAIVQKIFTLYCSGLLLKTMSDYEIYAVNSIPLNAEIETINSSNKKCKSDLSGKADVVIGKKLKDNFNTAGEKEILEETSIIGEMKPCFGSLYLCKSKIGDSTNQLLAEMLAISKMRTKAKMNGSNFVKGFISDCFFIRVAFRYVSEGKSFYAISSLNDTPELLALSIILLISDITVADICSIEGSIIIEDEEEDSANCDENDFDGDKSVAGEKLFVSKSDVACNKTNGNTNSNSKSYGTRRQHLKTRNSNIIYIGEDPLVEERRADLQNLAEWEACRLGRTYLNAYNLNLLEH